MNGFLYHVALHGPVAAVSEHLREHGMNEEAALRELLRYGSSPLGVYPPNSPDEPDALPQPTALRSLPAHAGDPVIAFRLTDDNQVTSAGGDRLELPEHGEIRVVQAGTISDADRQLWQRQLQEHATVALVDQLSVRVL